MNWLYHPIKPPSSRFYEQALARQANLTKPHGSLGELEKIACQLAAMQQTAQPKIEKIWVSIFAADHGIAEENVSAFPQRVTAEMVKNFANGGAAINVLSRFTQSQLEIIDVGLAHPIELKNIIKESAGKGTANFSKQQAMTAQQLQFALTAGKHTVSRALKHKTELFIAGEMGIANTSSATAIAAALTHLSVNQLTGAGTGITNNAIQHKAEIISKSLHLHHNFLETPLKVLQCLGGFEIAALVGATLFAAQQGLPIMVDGFISSIAVLTAIKINPDVKQWLFYAHKSQEKGHHAILEYLNAKPLLDLNMRLGEASGAVLAVPLLQMACQLHNDMATFSQANITT